MLNAPAWQTVTFAIGVGLAVLLQLVLPPDFTTQVVLLAVLVALVGLPHGALDLPIAEAVWPLAKWSRKLGFVSTYIGITLAVIIAWYLAPWLALVAFLAYSAYHFSADWTGTSGPLRLAGGAATIGAPALMHQAEVVTIFAQLAPYAAAEFGTNLAAYGGIFALCFLIGGLIFIPATRGQGAIEQLILWGAALMLPPLMFFGVYFCALHSIRHFTTAIVSVPKATQALVTAAILSGLVILVATTFVFMTNAAELKFTDKATLQAIFIGLAALTVPHMLLVEYFNRRSAAD
jgi:beta-carotene 15,15'-dioxygenase